MFGHYAPFTLEYQGHSFKQERQSLLLHRIYIFVQKYMQYTSKNKCTIMLHQIVKLLPGNSCWAMKVISHGVDCGCLWHDFRGWQEMLLGLLERIRWTIKEQVWNVHSKQAEKHLSLYFDFNNVECLCSDKMALQNVNNFKTSFPLWRWQAFKIKHNSAGEQFLSSKSCLWRFLPMKFRFTLLLRREHLYDGHTLAYQIQWLSLLGSL